MTAKIEEQDKINGVMTHLRREERGRERKNICSAGEFLSSNKGRIFNKETIYERLWGFDKEGDSAIITEHIRRIRSKFAKKSKKEIIETVWGVGYRWIL